MMGGKGGALLCYNIAQHVPLQWQFRIQLEVPRGKDLLGRQWRHTGLSQAVQQTLVQTSQPSTIQTFFALEPDQQKEPHKYDFKAYKLQRSPP